jgi:hypothetical protein
LVQLLYLGYRRIWQYHRGIAWSAFVFVIVMETTLILFTIEMRCARALGGGRVCRTSKVSAITPITVRIPQCVVLFLMPLTRMPFTESLSPA